MGMLFTLTPSMSLIVKTPLELHGAENIISYAKNISERINVFPDTRRKPTVFRCFYCGRWYLNVSALSSNVDRSREEAAKSFVTNKNF